MEMCVKVKNCLEIIILISVLSIHCNEATKLFNITEDAIDAGHELFRVVEKNVPGKTNITEVTKTVCEIINKFNLRHNTPIKPKPDVTAVYFELNSATLREYYRNFTSYSSYSIPKILQAIIDYCDVFNKKPILDFSYKYLDENVFDLQTIEKRHNTMYNLHNLLLKEDPDTGDSIMNILSIQPTKCRGLTSFRPQIFSSLLNYITSYDAFYYVLTQLNYAGFKMRQGAFANLDWYEIMKLKLIESTWTEKNVIEKIKTLEKDFIERNKKTMNRFINAMDGQSRAVWSCGDNMSEETFTKLENLFQVIIMNEVNLNEGETCKKECQDYYQTKQYGCYEGGICNQQRPCNGIIWDCGTRIHDSPINICLQDENNATRYQYVSTFSMTYGPYSDCSDQISVRNWPRGFYQCTYCTCTCEELTSESDRYFNLRPVQSDIGSNYVITNARFRKVNHIVHIQIEQGHLLNNGYIREGTLGWKDVENFTIYDENVMVHDIHTINWNKRKVYLGDVESPPNYVLTGLRIASVSDGIKLEIGSTPYNSTTGQLSNTIQWTNYVDIDSEWSELQFENRDEIITSNTAKYVKLRPNVLKNDAGQSTIPYIDNVSVMYGYRVPLSGAGLLTKNRKYVGTILALKFQAYDNLFNMREI